MVIIMKNDATKEQIEKVKEVNLHHTLEGLDFVNNWF